MCSIDNLKIDIDALSEGESAMAVSLGGDFFNSFEGSEMTQGDVHVDVSIRKTIHFSDVRFHATGTVEVPCHRCLDPMDVHVDTGMQLTVKIGSEYSEEDELIILAEDDPVLDLSWFVYESIMLSLPVKHVHAPGKCNPAMINMLNEHSVTRSDDTAASESIDPRWSKLAQLKLDN